MPGDIPQQRSRSVGDRKQPFFTPLTHDLHTFHNAGVVMPWAWVALGVGGGYYMAENFVCMYHATESYMSIRNIVQIARGVRDGLSLAIAINDLWGKALDEIRSSERFCYYEPDLCGTFPSRRWQLAPDLIYRYDPITKGLAVPMTDITNAWKRSSNCGELFAQVGYWADTHNAEAIQAQNEWDSSHELVQISSYEVPQFVPVEIPYAGTPYVPIYRQRRIETRYRAVYWSGPKTGGVIANNGRTYREVHNYLINSGLREIPASYANLYWW